MIALNYNAEHLLAVNVMTHNEMDIEKVEIKL